MRNRTMCAGATVTAAYRSLLLLNAMCGWCVVVLAAEPQPTAPAFPFSAEAARQAQEAVGESSRAPVVETNSLGMALSIVPSGEFMMGSPAEELSLWDRHQPDEALHPVKLTRPFRIGSHLVRVSDFRKFVADTEYKTQAEKSTLGGWGIVDGKLQRNPKFNWRNIGLQQRDDYPVVNVSWNDAGRFCDWLSRKESRRYRLPTEAEWEWACRAGTDTAFPFGRSCNGAEANCNGTRPFGTKSRGPFLNRPTSVGSYAANAFGLFDMCGNANEWCSDWYEADFFSRSPSADPTGPADGSVRAVRGGGWLNWAESCRSADRGGSDPNECGIDLGFRVLREE